MLGNARAAGRYTAIGRVLFVQAPAGTKFLGGIYRVKQAISEGEMKNGSSEIVLQINEACEHLHKLAQQANQPFLAYLIRMVILETDRLLDRRSLPSPTSQ